MSDSVCWASGPCVACGVLIPIFNPVCVPSIRVNGEREPLCRTCFERWNQIHRTSKGLEPLPLNPNAYQPANEVDV